MTTQKQAMAELERVQHEVDVAGAWQLNQQVELMLSKMSLDGEAEFDQQSGGMKRRVLLARALVIEARSFTAGRTHQPSGYGSHTMARRAVAGHFCWRLVIYHA